MPPSGFPVSNSTTSFWRSNPLPLDNHRSTPHLPSKVDIVVVGAGYAGASTVYHILQHCKDLGISAPSIAILEAREACSGATGRNGGQLKPDPYNRPATIAATHGVEAASECASFEAAHLPAIRKVVEEEGIDCDFVMTRCCDVLLTDEIHQQMKAGASKLKQLNVPVMNDVYFVEGQKAEQLSGVKGAKACFTYTAGHIFPYKFVHGLLRKALDQGVNLQTHTPVISVTKEPDLGGYLTLATTRGQVMAKKIVYATNAYTSAILPEYENKIIPVRGICSHIVPGRSPGPSLAQSYIIRSSPTAYEYLIPRLDGSIVVGGARSTYLDELDTWYNNVNDDKLISKAQNYFDGYMQRLFRGWEDSGAKTSKVWTGSKSSPPELLWLRPAYPSVMGYSTDNVPHVGTVPGRRNQFIVAGFSGHGMPQVFLCAKGVASMVMEGATFESTKIPRLYEATQARLDSPKNSILELWESTMKAQHTAKL